MLRFAAGLALLFAFDALGGSLSGAIGGVLPGSVLGMMLLVGALASGVVKPDWVRPASDRLLPHLGLFFLPLAVGAALAVDFTSRAVQLAGLVAVVSTLVGLAVVSRFHQTMRSR